MLWIEEWLQELKESMAAVDQIARDAMNQDGTEVSEDYEVAVATLPDELIRFAVVWDLRQKEAKERMEDLKKRMNSMTLGEIRDEANAIHKDMDFLNTVFWREVRTALPELAGLNKIGIRKDWQIVRVDEEKEPSGVVIGISLADLFNPR